jgi:hypothetical protein
VQDTLFAGALALLAARFVAAETSLFAHGDAVLFAKGGEALVDFIFRHRAAGTPAVLTVGLFGAVAWSLGLYLRSRVLPGLGPEGCDRVRRPDGPFDVNSEDRERGPLRAGAPFVAFAALSLLANFAAILLGAIVLGAAYLVSSSLYAAHPVRAAHILEGASAGVAICVYLIRFAAPLAQAAWVSRPRNDAASDAHERHGWRELLEAFLRGLSLLARRATWWRVVGPTLPGTVAAALATYAAFAHGGVVAAVGAGCVVRLGRALSWDQARALAEESATK